MAATTIYQSGAQLVSLIGNMARFEVDVGGAPSSEAQLAGGTVTLNGATPVTVVNANLTANSVITFGLKTVGGTVGAQPAVQTVTPGTGFTVQGTSGDTSTYNYVIIG